VRLGAEPLIIGLTPFFCAKIKLNQPTFNSQKKEKARRCQKKQGVTGFDICQKNLAYFTIV